MRRRLNIEIHIATTSVNFDRFLNVQGLPHKHRKPPKTAENRQNDRKLPKTTSLKFFSGATAGTRPPLILVPDRQSVSNSFASAILEFYCIVSFFMSALSKTCRDNAGTV